MGRRCLLAVSLGAHALLGAIVGAVPPEVRHEITPITIVESKKPRAIRDVPPPPPPAPHSAPATHPARAKAAPPTAPKAAPARPTNAAAAPSLEGLPDFGLSLSGGGGGGLAIPSGGVSGPVAAAPAVVKTLLRAPAPRANECADPPTKPRLLGRPQPAYPEGARAAGVAGRVRVEISIDDRGRVASVRLLQGLGHGCDEAALSAARAMTFEPALRCGKATSATFKVSFNFAPPAP